MAGQWYLVTRSAAGMGSDDTEPVYTPITEVEALLVYRPEGYDVVFVPLPELDDVPF